MKNTIIAHIENEKEFINLMKNYEPTLNLAEEEAALLLGYVDGHGYRLVEDSEDGFICIDAEEPENGILLRGFGELVDKVSDWNYEFLTFDELTESNRKEIIHDMEIIDALLEKVGARNGQAIGTPTVAELIDILSKLPQDYRIFCCGGENYLYFFPKNKGITIDHEWYLS